MTKKPKYDVEQFDEAQINDRALVEYEKEYSERGLKDKIAKYGKVIGAEVLYKALQLWFVLQRDDVPASTKAIVMGALGYLIAPLDFLPDLTPILGYSDDMVAIAFALVKVQGYVDEDVKMKSKNMLSKIFSDETISALG
ncbi:MAG: DUF1232 domain-containing protein [Phascolarctobacterium sp.]|nr:DUF1232 domain-containing protein [Phascolarctobacterium sp.]